MALNLEKDKKRKVTIVVKEINWEKLRVFAKKKKRSMSFIIDRFIEGLKK